MRGILAITVSSIVESTRVETFRLISDSPHLRYVSGPLARAGISILYQSSYFCDYLFCKSEDYEKVATIFVSEGCKYDSHDTSDYKLMSRADQ
jgi:hypothetical protein